MTGWGRRSNGARPGANRSILLTGCSTGLGLETAVYLAKCGFDVYASMRHLDRRARLDAAALQADVRLGVVRLDLTDRDSIEAAVQRVVAQSGGIFGLVNNAAIILRGPFEDLGEDEIRRVYDTNVFGTMAVTRAVLPHMRAAGHGRIVTISSVGGRIASFGLSAYCSSKFALEGFAEALALEIAPFGLHSVLVEPGIFDSPYWTQNRGLARNADAPGSSYYEMFRRHEEIANRVAKRTHNSPTHVARAVHEALTAQQPRMRYLVGQPASLLVALRRYAPSELFERVYFGLLLRELTRSGVPRRTPMWHGHTS